MVYTEREKLTIITSDDQADTVSFGLLRSVLPERPSNVIYCEAKGKLYGMISMGDIARAGEDGKDYVTVNRNFTCLTYPGYMQAKQIFHEKEKINAIPVVNEKKALLGDYSRWDDWFIARMPETEKKDSPDSSFAQYYKHVVFVRPIRISVGKHKAFERMDSYLRSLGIIPDCIEHYEIMSYLDCADYILFVDENECRAMDTLFVWILHEDDRKARFITYQNFLKEYSLEVIGEYFRKLQESGVAVYNLVFERTTQNSSYFRDLMIQIRKKYAALGEKVNNRLHPAMYQDFFDDLYAEEYAEEIMKIDYSIETRSGCGRLKDCDSKYYHVTNGERHTCEQPKDYERTVYFVGACYVYGHYAEDGNTIESFLQERIPQRFKARVVNCGSPSYAKDVRRIAACVKTLPLKKGDIVIYGSKSFEGINKINLLDVCEKYQIPAKWMADHPMHCNHQIRFLYAEAIYHVIEPVLQEPMHENERFFDQNRDYIKSLYIDCYFRDWNFHKYEKTGAVIMNCNPFTYGHRYLIERALSVVDFLIIFVVEEDMSLFSFEERFAMVRDGVADLENVKVVPSGPFILSEATFPEYFIKEADEDIVQNVENDITIFAERIAPYLGITHRFVGEEPEDNVTGEYNLAMKKILPFRGIELCEVPRKEGGGRYISASLVRRCLEEPDMDRLEELVPESTRKILFQRAD